MTHRSTLRVRFNEIDPYGHVNHAVYVTYFEVGRTDALDACGVPIDEVAERGIQLVVTNLEVRFRRPALAAEDLVIETELGEMRRASGVWHQRILRAATGELLVSAEVRIGVTDAAGKPCRPPEWLIDSLTKLQPDQAP